MLIHELAHLRRHDCHWNLLRQIATSLFFFQPLLWKLSHRIETTAEEVCDDYVVQFGGDRQEYAHRLVDIAELSSVPMAAAGVGIVSLRSMLARRVTRIMDTSRTLSTRAGNLLLAVVLVGGLIGTTITGLVGLAPSPTQAEAELDVAESDVELDRDAKEDIADEDKTITTQGTVVDPDGKPVSGAKVFAVWVLVGDVSARHHSASQRSEHTIIAETRSDSSGVFELSFSMENPDKNRLARGLHIVATASGYGPAWTHRQQLAQDRTPTLRLARNENVRGQILDMEGKPIPGVRVSVRSLRPASSEQAIANWIEDARTKTPPTKLDDYHSAGMSGADAKYPFRFPFDWNDGGLAHGSPALPSAVESDESGRFEFRGLGADRLATIQVEGPSIAKTNLQVVTRDMLPLSARPLDMVGARSGVYYGRAFEFVAEPTQPVVGTVTDLDTGEPIADVEVRLGQFSDSLWSQQDFLSTRTEGNPHVDYRIGLRMVVTPGVFGLDCDSRNRGELAADEDFVANINRSAYYRMGPRTDQDGSLTLAELIPGATYRMWALEEGKHKVLKEFTVESGEMLDLGEFTIVRND